MHRKKRFWYHLMLAGLLIKSSVLASVGNQDTAPSIAPRLRADFQSGLPELSIAPGEKRLGRGGNRGIARKHPYSVRKVAPNLRNSLLEYVRQDEAVGKQVLALEEDMTVDVLGALNLGSGTFAVWLRPGGKFYAGTTLFSVGNYDVWITRGEPMWSLKTQTGEGGKKELVFIGGNWAEIVCKVPLQETWPSGWLHLTVVWDENHGAKIYWNGKLAGSTWKEQAEASELSKEFYPQGEPLEVQIPRRMLIGGDEGALLGSLEIYDAPLSAEGIEQVAFGGELTVDMLEPTSLNAHKRLAGLGWSNRAEEEFVAIPSGKKVTIREVVVLDVRENNRAAGWRAVDGFPFNRFPWWYHGYGQGTTKELHLLLETEVTANTVTGLGDFRGKMIGQDGEKSMPLTGGNTWFMHSVSDDLGDRLTIVQEDGYLHDVRFYDITTGEVQTSDTNHWGIVPAKDGGSAVLPCWKQRELQAGYQPHDRMLWVAEAAGDKGSAKATADKVVIPALSYWHIATRPQSQDFYLGGVELRVKGTGKSGPLKAKLVLHDALSPHRELARLNLQLQPEAQSTDQGDYIVSMDIRDTMIPAGKVVWATLLLEREFELDTENSGIRLIAAKDPQRALALWKQWELRTVREMFEALSEPRPWSGVGGDFAEAWWLRLTIPEYEQLDWGLKRLRERFPKDPLVLGIYQYTHPAIPNPIEDMRLPEVGDAPEWAVMARECLGLYRHFVDWWIDNRQHPNGEFGHHFKDDTDLIQDWPDLALIADPKGKYAESFMRLADGVSFRYRVKGGPIIANGLNTRWTDALHAYEDGLNVQPWNFLLDYGNPRKYQQLLNTVSRYDGFLLSEAHNGMREFRKVEGKGQLYLNDKRMAGDHLDSYAYLFSHAGLAAAWYGKDPAIWQMLEEWGRWSITRKDTRWRGAGATLLSGLYLRDGDMKWLEPLIDQALWNKEKVLVEDKGAALYAPVASKVKGADRQKTFEKTYAPAEERFKELETTNMGGGDTRFDQSWLDWKFTGDKRHLVEGLKALYQRVKFTMPMLTEAEQSGDRVAIPKQLVSLMYTGGIPTSRNRYFYPDFAVSYEEMDDNFAALVLDSSPKSIDLLLYSFDKQERTGRVITWQLEPGEYEVTQGPDHDGDDRADSVVHRQNVSLHRREGFTVQIPSATTWVVNVRQVRAEPTPALLGDAALDWETISLNDGKVRVPVYNLGAVALQNVQVRFRTQDNSIVLDQIIPVLPAVTNWKLGEAAVEFQLPSNLKNGTVMFIEIDPDRKLREITTRNNRISVDVRGK